MATKHGQSLPNLHPGEVTLLGYAADDSRDTLTLTDKEALVLELARQVQEQQLEKALLEQGRIRVNIAHSSASFSILTIARTRTTFRQ